MSEIDARKLVERIKDHYSEHGPNPYDVVATDVALEPCPLSVWCCEYAGHYGPCLDIEDVCRCAAVDGREVA